MRKACPLRENIGVNDSNDNDEGLVRKGRISVIRVLVLKRL